MRKIYQILCPSNVTKICCQQLFVLLSWNYDFSTIFPFTESTHICALYMVQTLCNMKCRFCVLKIEISPKSSVIFKIHKNCRCSDLTFWLGLDFIIKIHYCTSSETTNIRRYKRERWSSNYFMNPEDLAPWKPPG